MSSSLNKYQKVISFLLLFIPFFALSQPVPINKYDGIYTVKSYVLRAGDPVRTGNPVPFDLRLKTYSSNAVQCFDLLRWADNAGIGIGYPIFTIDPISNEVTVSGDGTISLSTLTGPGYSNKYNPVTKSFTCAFSWGAGPSSRLSLDTFIFTGQSPIKINSMSPVRGTSGSVVTVNGANIGKVSYARFGSQQADSFWVTSDTSIRVVVGAGQTGKLYVSNNFFSDSLSQFTYVNPIIAANTLWKDVGTLPSTVAKNFKVNIAISKTNIPYVVYADSIDRIVVKRFDGVNWQNVGGLVSLKRSSNPLISVDTLNIPYVAYYDSVYNGYIVKRLSNSSWVIVGNNTLTKTIISNADFATSYAGKPFLSGKDTNQNFVVFRFDGASWTNTGLAQSNAYEMSLALDRKTSTPYVFGNFFGTINVEGFVKKWNGATWDSVGTVPKNNGNGIFYPTIQTDRTGNPVIAFQDDNGFERISVYRFNGTDWKLMGPERFSKSRSYYLSLAIDKSNYPSVAFQDGSYNLGGTVMKMLSNGSWSRLGSRGFANKAYFTQHAYCIDSANIPLLAYTDSNNKIRVMAYNPLKPDLGKDTILNTCNGSIVNLFAVLKPIAYPASYIWNTPKPDSISQPGTYTAIVTNTYGLSDTAVVTVVYNPKPYVGKDTAIVVCKGTVVNLTQLYNTNGYSSVVWNTTRPDSVTKSGNYSVVVSNQTGCKDTAVVKLLIDTVKATFTITNVKCYGLATGVIRATVTNGIAPYMYKIDSLAFATTNIFGQLKAGLHVVTIMDAAGCSSVFNVIISQPLPIRIVTTKVNESCPNAKDGQITATASGGVPPYTYRLGATGVYSAGNVFNNLGQGSYRVYVKDTNSCLSYTPTIIISRTSANCFSFAKSSNQPKETINELYTTLWPNPTKGKAMLQVKGYTGIYQVKITSVEGKLIWQSNSFSGPTVQLPELNYSGVYLVTFNNGKEQKVMRLLVKR